MGEKEIAGGDGPKSDPRAGGGQGPGGQGPGGQGGPGQGGDGGKGGGFVDPMPPRPQAQKIITGPKKDTKARRIPVPGRGSSGGIKGDG